jgi:hypothetical protein
MADILPAQRDKWAERFLILALWCDAAADAKQRARAGDVALVAHALTGGQPLDAIPAMGVITMVTIRAMLLGGW